jgi:hypothetical protein
MSQNKSFLLKVVSLKYFVTTMENLIHYIHDKDFESKEQDISSRTMRETFRLTNEETSL